MSAKRNQRAAAPRKTGGAYPKYGDVASQVLLYRNYHERDIIGRLSLVRGSYGRVHRLSACAVIRSLIEKAGRRCEKWASPASAPKAPPENVAGAVPNAGKADNG